MIGQFLQEVGTWNIITTQDIHAGDILHLFVYKILFPSHLPSSDISHPFRLHNLMLILYIFVHPWGYAGWCYFYTLKKPSCEGDPLLYYTCGVSFVLRSARVICHVYRHNVVVRSPLFPRAHYFSTKIRIATARGKELPCYKKVSEVGYNVGLLVPRQIKYLLLPLKQDVCKFYLNYTLLRQRENSHSDIWIFLILKIFVHRVT